MALGTFEIIAGDFKLGKEHQLLNDKFTLKVEGKFFRESIKTTAIEKIEVATDESVQKVGASVGWALAGGLIAGPLGAVTAGVIGGKKNQTTFICHFKDGRKFVGIIPSKLYAKLAAPFMI
ncbi:MAG: hypothetical protein V3V02_10795 [Rhizobiaceae bacterium]